MPLLGALALFVFMAEDPNQFWFPLLGWPSEGTPVLTTPLGCQVQAHGWDQPVRPKRLRKARRYMTSIGVPEYVQAEYETYAHELPENLLVWVDAAFLEIQARWQKCGGHYATVANRMKPSDINITLVPLPFWVPSHGRFAVGMTESNGRITLCVGSLSRGTTESSAPDWLRRVDKLAEWEIGNRFALAAGIKNREIGNSSPCS